MTELTLESLAARIEALERRLAERITEVTAKSWRDSVGLFDDDPDFDREVLSEARAYREAEREAVRREVVPDEPTIIEISSQRLTNRLD